MNLDSHETIKSITERRTFAPVDKWIASAASPDAPQWIGDRIRAISLKRNDNTISDKMMILRNTLQVIRVCRWDAEAKREGSDKPGMWKASKTLAEADFEFARKGINERPLSRSQRNAIIKGYSRLVKPPELLSQSTEAVARRKEVARIERNWRKADKRRRNNSK